MRPLGGPLRLLSLFNGYRLRSIWVLVAAVIIFLLVAFVAAHSLISYETKAYLLNKATITSCNFDANVIAPATCFGVNDYDSKIPNIVHLVYILKDPLAGDFPLQFSHYLSIYAVSKRWQPDIIYLHTNAEAEGGAVERARNGTSGKWQKLFFEIPGLKINTVEALSHAGNGKEIKMLEHKSDFARVKAVHDFGGIYIDLDVHALQDINPVRDAGYRSVAGRQLGGDLQSGSFMSEKGGRLVKEWMERMHIVYDGGWITHSNKLLTTIGEEIVDSEPCELLIMGRDAFAPGGWVYEDTERLYGEHDDVESNTANITQGDPLPDRNDMSAGDRPDWAFDYSCTYLLHAFSLEKPRDGVKHNRITPQFVLERKSNFGRALYPIAKELYEKGIITIDETI